MIPTEYVGREFRQLVGRLRWTRGGKAGNEVRSYREMDENNNFIDEPPIIVFDRNADADIERLLRSGAIVLIDAPARARDAGAPPKMPPDVSDLSGAVKTEGG